MERRDRDFSLLETEGQGKVVALSRELSGAMPTQAHTCSKDKCPDFLSHTHIQQLWGCAAFEKCRDKIPEAMLIQQLSGCHSYN